MPVRTSVYISIGVFVSKILILDPFLIAVLLMQLLWHLPSVGCDVVCTLSLQGRFTIAAKHHMTIAEIYETDMVDVEKVNVVVSIT